MTTTTSTATRFAIEMFCAPPFFSERWSRMSFRYDSRAEAEAALARSLLDADQGPESFRVVEVR